MSASKPQLSIKLLGPFEVWKDEERLTHFRADSARALLAYLAMQQGIGLRREQLAALLSPDRPDAEARAYLRRLLLMLRQALKEQAAHAPYIEANRKHILLRDEPQITVDVIRFVTLIDGVKQHQHRRLAGCAPCIAALNSAVALVRGEFMSGYALANDVWEEWLLVQRSHFQQTALDALGQLAHIRSEQNAWSELIEIGRTILRLDAWHEGGHRFVMQGLWQLGERATALAQYEQCEKMLWEQLGVEPEKTTQHLRDQIAQQAAMPPSVQVDGDELHNLPEIGTPFFGRTAELTLLQKRLTDPRYRLVTLVGAGGVGKSRLSVEVGRRLLSSFEDGVWFVPLVEVDRQDGHEAIVTAIAQALDFTFSGSSKPIDQLCKFLREAELLLVLDQSEHLVHSADILLTLLKRTRHLAILATSRQTLGFIEETMVPVVGLHTQQTINMANPAVALFVERAERMSGTHLSPTALPAIQAIIQLVEGNALALELAASWTRVAPVHEIVQRIEESADFLATRYRNIPKRHRSMRAVFETSWELLEPQEQTVFARLTVFRGGFSAEAAKQVTSATLFDLDDLIEKSLISRQGQRFHIHELLRQFAAARLADRSTINRLHGHCYLPLLTAQRDTLQGVTPLQAIDMIERDEPNIWQAWAWAINQQAWSLLIDGVAVSAEYLLMRGRAAEAIRRFEQAHKLLEQVNHPRRGTLLIYLAHCHLKLGNFTTAFAQAERGLQLTTSIHDQTIGALVTAEALYQQGSVQQAADVLETIYSVLVGQQKFRLNALVERRLGYFATHQGLFSTAEKWLNKAHASAHQARDTTTQGWVWLNLGQLAYAQTDMVAARKNYNKAQALFQQNGVVEGLLVVKGAIGSVSFYLDRFVEAESYLINAKQGYHLASNWFGKAFVLNFLGLIAGHLGRLEEAVELLREAAALYQQIGNSLNEINTRLNAAYACIRVKRLSQAKDHLEQLTQIAQRISNTTYLAKAQLAYGDLALATSNYQQAQQHYEQAQRYGQQYDAVLALEATTGLVHILIEQQQFAQAYGLVEQIFNNLSTNVSINNLISRTRTEWSMYVCFKHANDPRATLVRNQALAHIQTQLNSLTNAEDKQRYLANVQFAHLLLDN